MKTATPTLTGLEPLLSIEELPEYLHVPVRTLYDWRLAGKGPREVHVGRQLRFFVSNVHAWLTAQRETEPDAGRWAVRRHGQARTPIGTFGDTQASISEAANKLTYTRAW
jgi:excisionase family DNA binding protein